MGIISFSVKYEEIQRFRAVAKALGISASELFRRMFKKWVGDEDGRNV